MNFYFFEKEKLPLVHFQVIYALAFSEKFSK
jgi:hypothetical protein